MKRSALRPSAIAERRATGRVAGRDARGARARSTRSARPRLRSSGFARSPFGARARSGFARRRTRVHVLSYIRMRHLLVLMMIKFVLFDNQTCSDP